MSERVCSVGVDFGTESGRALLIDARTGEQLAVAVVPYASAVIDAELPGSGERLPPDWALQDPDDWIAVLESAIPEAVATAGVDPATVVGIGVDVTSCTVLPVTGDGVPLCRDQRWRERRHAWPKLWKHHSAQPVADRLNAVAAQRGEDFLARYGGKISSEWYFPKLIELWLEDREIYDASAAFIEATDWIVWQLTGHECRQSCTASYKAMWSPTEGLPATAYFEAAYPGFDRPGRQARNDLRAARDARRHAHRRLGAAPRVARRRRGGGRERRLVRFGTGCRRPFAGHVRDRDRHLDL